MSETIFVIEERNEKWNPASFTVQQYFEMEFSGASAKI